MSMHRSWMFFLFSPWFTFFSSVAARTWKSEDVRVRSSWGKKKRFSEIWIISGREILFFMSEKTEEISLFAPKGERCQKKAIFSSIFSDLTHLNCDGKVFPECFWPLDRHTKCYGRLKVFLSIEGNFGGTQKHDITFSRFAFMISLRQSCFGQQTWLCTEKHAEVESSSHNDSKEGSSTL